MSNYRDDIQETAVASDGTQGRARSLTEDHALATSTLLTRIRLFTTEMAVASDEVVDQSLMPVVERATVNDLTTGIVRRNEQITDTLKFSDQIRSRMKLVLTDQANATETLIDRCKLIHRDTANVSDSIIGQRRVKSLPTDSAKVTDQASKIVGEQIQDTLVASDSVQDRIYAMHQATDSIIISDSAIGQRKVRTLVTEPAYGIDTVQDRLYASLQVTELVLMEDQVSSSYGAQGQAWTANADSWAMSRYSPYTFSSITVIDGKLYGVAEDGIYALAGGSTAITGHIKTGKLDLGQGNLVHPLAAYLEYDLVGSAEMDVTTTQSGRSETYTYVLSNALANELTSGRFVFGRGLRGRHFSFNLQISGEQGYINDLNIEVAPAKRRI